MSDVNDLVNDAIAEVNEKRTTACKQEVKGLVLDILENEVQIKTLVDKNLTLKAKLKELQKPEAVTLEL